MHAAMPPLHAHRLHDIAFTYTNETFCLCLTVHAGITFYLNDTTSINLLGTDERLMINAEHDNQQKLPDI